MGADKPEADGFLAVIEKKIAALKTLADSYRAAHALGALGQPGDIDAAALGGPLGSRADAPIELPQGALLGKSLPAAIKLYLSAVRKKQTTREITTALREGGIESTAANFENNVTSALHRLKAAGDVLKFNDGWGLAELYPENLRNRIAAKSDAKPKRVVSKTKRSKSAPAKKAAAPPRALPAGPSIDARIVACVASNPLRVFSLKDLGEAVNEPDAKRLAMALGRVQSRGKIVKHPEGGFSAPRAAERLKAV